MCVSDERERVVDEEPIDWTAFEQARARFGPDFLRRLSFLREDGERTVDQIECAMRACSAVELVKPAGTLKDGAYDFGAEALGEVAERIELAAIHCVQTRETPDEALPLVAGLRALFEGSLGQLEEASSPLLRKTRAL